MYNLYQALGNSEWLYSPNKHMPAVNPDPNMQEINYFHRNQEAITLLVYVSNHYTKNIVLVSLQT